jgi:hypothetical protein
LFPFIETNLNLLPSRLLIITSSFNAVLNTAENFCRPVVPLLL